MLKTKLLMLSLMCISPLLYAQETPTKDSLPVLDSSTTQTGETISDSTLYTKSAASLLKSGPAFDQYAAGKISQLTSQAIEGWLKQYGNARITLNAQSDNSTALAGSSADLLFGLHNQDSRLDYIQFDTHYQDTEDMIFNVGLGQRYFMTNKTMLGYNVFYDRNINSGVSRSGVGFELWRDYFKFSGNGYFALSDWQNSEQLEDYDEKAADGYDMQIEAYLPTYAQLGGHLKYEQYFGDNVALFDTNHLQTDPSAITVGMSYTPIPLITFALDYKKGNDSLDDTSISAAINYAIGVPWSQQISSDYVQTRRSLVGSRFDFVSRNNDIVMQYRKQDVIKLILPTQLNGQATQQLPLVATVEAKNGLDHIQWDSSSSLLQAGGTVIPGSDATHFTVSLPATAGQYVLNGTAYDNHHNASNSAQTRFIVADGGGNAQITFQPLTTAWTDTAENIAVEVKDASGQPAPGTSVTFSTTSCTGNDCTLSDTTVTAIDTQGKAIAKTTLLKPAAGTTVVRACVTGTSACSDQPIKFYQPPFMTGELKLLGKLSPDTSLPTTWISNMQFSTAFATRGGDGNYSWKSSDESAATVDESGLVTIKNKLADFSISVTSLGRTSVAAKSLNVTKATAMLHIDTNEANYADTDQACTAAGRKIPALQDFTDITTLWGDMSKYPTYSALRDYVWAYGTETDVAPGYRMSDGVSYPNLSKETNGYQGCLEK